MNNNNSSKKNIPGNSFYYKVYKNNYQKRLLKDRVVFMKLAIITPCFMPVPAVNGGAVEQLITYFIEANEKYHKYDIDLYTVADEKLNSYTFKYTNIIQIKNYQSNYLVKGYYFLKRTFSNVFRIQLCSDYMSYKIPRIYKKTCMI